MILKPKLVNAEFQDPILYISIPQKSQVVLFDLGYCFRLKVKDIRKISHIFISHTHIDHFAGFDHILRLSLDREKVLHLYGPPGFINNVRGKLSGYTWNLKESILLDFRVWEVHPHRILSADFKGAEGYGGKEIEETPFNPEQPLLKTEDFQVRTVFLEHKMPILCFRIDASDSYNVDPVKMKELGLSPGKWVKELKERTPLPIEPQEEIEVDGKIFNLFQLSRQLVIKTPGTSIGYVVDTICNKNTHRLLKVFLKDVDHLFSECAYLNIERELAEKNYHLTARQAGTLAKNAGAKTLYPFHFSRRYEGQYDKLYEEIRDVFPRVKKPPLYSGDNSD